MSQQWGRHAVDLGPDVTVKRFAGKHPEQRPGSAAQREWQALTLIERYAPGLAPAPVRLDLDGPEPSVTMSRLAGTPLRGIRVSAAQRTAMAGALTALHAAIPPGELARLPLRLGHQRLEAGSLLAWAGAPPPGRVPGPLITQAIRAGLDWLARSGLAAGAGELDVPPVLGQGDGNLENFLWDGTRVRVVDFEYSGRSDRAFELADVTEHVSCWVDTEFDAAAFLDCFDLSPAETARLRECRRLFALCWLKLLLLQDPPHPRNPPGTVERQAQRVLDRLG
ncbi:MAG TPA: aminoglycoside phosphotransferase family protein [Streptosporangiaceae bacterium]|jgi:hypothetical protein